MRDAYQSLDKRYSDLLVAYFAHTFTNDRAKEYATHGFPRRLGILVQCIQNLFTLLPPESDEIPSRENRLDAMINLHAFVFNVYGALDNLAWIWIREKAITRADGRPIPDAWVGLGPENTCVRESFSKGFQDYLKARNEWFEHLANFRHALAHRIPLYIPPYVIPEKNRAAYDEFEVQKAEAVKALAFDKRDSLAVEQLKLTEFKPWMKHSFEEGSKTIVFHPQILSDFATVEEIGHKMLEELTREPGQ